jgi:hypothetical protein
VNTLLVPALLGSEQLALPSVTAVAALRLVHAKTRVAFRASPLRIFLDDETLYSDIPDALQVCDRAYSVFCAVATVKVQQFGAGKVSAGKTVLMVAGCKLHAIHD